MSKPTRVQPPPPNTKPKRVQPPPPLPSGVKRYRDFNMLIITLLKIFWLTIVTWSDAVAARPGDRNPIVQRGFYPR